jgi:hypothetical protein
MRGEQSVGGAGLRRPLLVLVLMVAAVAAMLVGPPAAARAAGSTNTGPRLTAATVSSSQVDGSGGVLTVSATTIDTKRCHLQVTPKLQRRPPSKVCTGSAVRWTVHLPANEEAVPVRYHFTLSASGAHHTEAPERHRAVTEDATLAPPTIDSFTATTPQLDFVGGRTHLVLTTSRNLTCALTVSPTVPNIPPARKCTKPTVKWPLDLPANSSTTAITYTVGVTVTGSHHQQATAATSVVVAAHPPPCPGQTSTATPTTTAFFNDPTTHQPADQTRVVDAEINLICDAQLPKKGVPTSITLGMYIYQLDDMSQALIWAQQYMHASVHVLLDGSNKFAFAPDGTVIDNPAYDDLVAGLPTGSVLLCGPNAGTALPPRDDTADDGTGVFPTGTGCAGDNIMHSKLLIVSAVDAARDPAIFSSSQNLGAKAENAAMNNGLQIVGNRTLYQRDATYFATIAQDKPQPDVGDTFATSAVSLPGATATDTYFPRNEPAEFPKNEKYHPTDDEATDSVANLLNSVDCSNPGDSAGVHTDGTGHTSIRIAMSAFNKRPLVKEALESLADQGCDIGVVYTKMSDNTMTGLTAHNITPMQLNDGAFSYTDGSGTGLIFVHDKYLLISGGLKVGGQTQTNQDVVLTGSANFTQRSLHRNDEASIAYQQTATSGGNPIFDAYAANWDHLAAIVASIPPSAPPA